MLLSLSQQVLRLLWYRGCTHSDQRERKRLPALGGVLVRGWSGSWSDVMLHGLSLWLGRWCTGQGRKLPQL